MIIAWGSSLWQEWGVGDHWFWETIWDIQIGSKLLLQAWKIALDLLFNNIHFFCALFWLSLVRQFIAKFMWILIQISTSRAHMVGLWLELLSSQRLLVPLLLDKWSSILPICDSWGYLVLKTWNIKLHKRSLSQQAYYCSFFWVSPPTGTPEFLGILSTDINFH